MLGCSTTVVPEQEADRSPFFPLQVGSYWAFQSQIVDSFGNRYRDTLAVFGTANIDGHSYFLFGDDSAPMFLRINEEGHILSYRNGHEALWFDFNLETGATYEHPYGYPYSRSYGGPRNYTVTVSRGIRVESPAGTFENCIRLYFDDPGARDDEHSYTFAHGVGIVERWGEWPGIRELSGYRLEGPPL